MWHFQLVPGDQWDYDATQPLMLADLPIGGRIAQGRHAGAKNAFFYVLDRGTGEFISATPYAQMTWATGVDPKTGRPDRIADRAYDGDERGARLAGPGGAHNWNPMAFHPAPASSYLPVKEGFQFLHVPDAEWRPGS